MAKDVTFQLDTTAAGKIILQDMCANIVKQSAQAIKDRATGMASAQSTEAPGYSLFVSVGTIKRGRRAIATVKANDGDAHQEYIAHQALIKAKDAGRV